MHTIEVDFEVLKALMARRETEAVTYNDVIRRMLGLQLTGGREVARVGPLGPGGGGDWTTKGITFPVGTEFRANYKGRTHVGRVEAGRLLVNGKGYESPSAAAVAITGTSVNGWRFWEFRRPGETSWRIIEALRPAK